MSDFLTNLAARAIAPPTLRPRIRSRFEPGVEEPLSPEWPVSPMARRPASGRRAPEALASVEPQTITHVSRDVEHEVEHDVRRVIETQERVVRVPQPIETEREVVRHRYETQPPRIIREQSPEIHHHRHTRITSERAPRVIAPAKEIVTQSAAEPTVHVSIGRIEVRATPQPQQQPHREPKRGMSIDDYVARRKAKERR